MSGATAYVPREALAQMFDVAPRDWWRFVPCSTCNASRLQRCQMGGMSFGLARQPHAARVASARVLHGTLWLLANGFKDDVLGEMED